MSGNGFQSIKGGHGGIYVFFGTVSSGWQPSKGGATGKDYFYVPDSEAKNNQGFQRYVAFPGSDTASSANGGTMSASGSWSTQLVVPGAEFKAYDRAGNIRTIDCRKVTCGVITVGAHGVVNANNETFTPVSVGTVAQAAPTATVRRRGRRPVGRAGVRRALRPRRRRSPPGRPPSRSTGPPRSPATCWRSPRAGCRPGSRCRRSSTTVLPAPGRSWSAPTARSPASITLPAATGAGTHELRLFGVEDPPSVQFAVVVSDAPVAADVAPSSAGDDDELRTAWLFVGAAAVLLLVALVRLGLRMRKATPCGVTGSRPRRPHVVLAGLLLAVPPTADERGPEPSPRVVQLDDAVLRWGLNNESSNRAYAPRTYNFFSAGRGPRPGRGRRRRCRRPSGSSRPARSQIQKWDGSAWRKATWAGLTHRQRRASRSARRPPARSATTGSWSAAAPVRSTPRPAPRTWSGTAT